MRILKEHLCFGGRVQFWEHDSSATGTKMKFSTFTPAGPVHGALIWLSGLTCTDENFVTKAGALATLAQEGLLLVCPDTSPRGLNLPHENEAYDFGSGAGFYLNATTEGYRDHYKMYDYIAHELLDMLARQFQITSNVSISGHSMGGHGALVIGLRETGKFKSISAFAPICHPREAPWGEKAFLGYLGDDRKTWSQYDATDLVRSGVTHPETILIDQGTNDEFLSNQLQPSSFADACRSNHHGGRQKLELRMQPGYDHSYYFISSFIQEHIQFHARHLKNAGMTKTIASQ